MRESILLDLTKEQIEIGELPLDDLLHNSLYYPASCTDGGVIKDCNTLRKNLGVVSFVYCDYHVTQEYLSKNLNMRGYHVMANRDLSIEEIGNRPNIHGYISLSAMEQNKMVKNINLYANPSPFARWMVFERDNNYTNEHGPQRISVLYVCGEGVATYLSLYAARNISPCILAIIQPGHGFGFNWTNFFDSKAALYRALKANPAGMPQYVYKGGIGKGYDNLDWEGYSLIDTISSYYSPGDGEAVLYKIKK